jgi:NAD(P)-dependent dehydrogenase (short-subunit alcohol dehydrogenase family)
MTDNRPLAGKLALITGASRGLGAAIAHRFAAAGAELILAARDRAALEAMKKIIPSARLFPVDLEQKTEIESLIEFCRAQDQPVEILVNNAAIQGHIGPFASADFHAWQAVFQVNFFAAARICQGLIEPMLRLGRGKIVNLSGGGAASPRPDLTAYGVSKCAVVRFTETLAQELAGTGIDANCIAPGAMNTRMLEEVLAAGPTGAKREYDKALKQDRAGGASLERAADLAAFLASPDSDGITGRLISAVWDNWPELHEHKAELNDTDIYTLRRIVPEDRGRKW